MQKGGQPRGSLPLLGTEVRACMSEGLGATVALGLPRVGQMWPPHTPGSVGPPEVPAHHIPAPKRQPQTRRKPGRARGRQPTFEDAQEEGKGGRVWSHCSPLKNVFLALC